MNGLVRGRVRGPSWEKLERSTRLRIGALIVAVASSTLLVALAPRHSPSAVVLVGTSTLACGAISVLERRRPRLGAAPMVAAIALVFAVAVITPPRTSNDLWSYTMYGRTVTVHSASPYNHPPSDFPSDPFLPHVSRIWRNRASVFGPAFVGLAATGTALAGDSVLANRLFFQMTAMLAAAASLAIVWRKTRSPAALAWLGLHPVFGAIAINGGHIDVLIGLGILVAALLASRQRAVLCGVVIGIAALMKLTALLALVGVVLWAWRRRNSRLAGGAVIAAGATVVLGYVPVFASASRVLDTADRTVTLASVWNPLAEVLLGHDAGRRIAHPLTPNSSLTAVFYLSLALVATLALFVGWRAAANRPRSRRSEPRRRRTRSRRSTRTRGTRRGRSRR